MVTLTHTLLLLLVLPPADERPMSLIMMEQSRLGYDSLDIEWSIEDAKEYPAGPARFRTIRAANGDEQFTMLGDPEGVTQRARDGAPGVRRPITYLFNGDGWWQHYDRNLVAKLSREHPAAAPRFPGDWGLYFQYQNVSAIGVVPRRLVPKDMADVWTVRTDDPIAINWSEEYLPREKLYRATKTLSTGSRCTWWIDPERGWNPVRVVDEPFPGMPEHSMEQALTLERFGDVWFPRKVEFSENGRVYSTVRVLSAKFDAPDAPRSLPATILGMPVGTDIHVNQGRGHTPRILRWDGHSVVEAREFDEAIASGKIQFGAQWKAAMAKGFDDDPSLTPEQRAEMQEKVAAFRKQAYLRPHSSLWEQYVRDFIRRFGLNEDQAQKAWQFYDDCKQRGDEYIQRHKAEFEKVEQELHDATVAGEAEAVRRATDHARILRRPIDAIFEERLKPRLETLPTRAQREAVEKAASQPAGD